MVNVYFGKWKMFILEAVHGFPLSVIWLRKKAFAKYVPFSPPDEWKSTESISAPICPFQSDRRPAEENVVGYK
jgi:hypothetical protein